MHTNKKKERGERKKEKALISPFSVLISHFIRHSQVLIQFNQRYLIATLSM
jgi:hypothetical protein